MGKAKFYLFKEQLTDVEISEFETDNNLSLPINLKKLLKKYNGGVVEEIEGVSILLSIKHGKNTIDIWLHIHQELENNISKDYLPIAEDVSGNPICINIKQGEDYGKIYIIYMDGGDLEPFLMANTLENLLEVEKIEDL